MLSLAHTIISLPFGLLPLHPISIFLLAFGFHFVLDSFLHWNIYPPRRGHFPYFKVSLDISFGLLVAFFLLGDRFLSWPILATILGGNMPDIIQSLWYFAGQPTKGWWRFVYPLFHFHDYIQWETTNIALGLISQIALITIVLLIVI